MLSVDIDYETVGGNMLMVAASGTAVKIIDARVRTARSREAPRA